MITEENKKFIYRDGHSYEKQTQTCVAHCSRGGIKNPYYGFQKCKRKLIGRVMCEFESSPFIRIKGLCQQSTIDRDFYLIEPKLGEGKESLPKKSSRF